MFDWLKDKNKKTPPSAKKKTVGGVIDEDMVYDEGYTLEHLEKAKKIIEGAKELDKKGSTSAVKRRKVV